MNQHGPLHLELNHQVPCVMMEALARQGVGHACASHKSSHLDVFGGKAAQGVSKHLLALLQR